MKFINEHNASYHIILMTDNYFLFPAIIIDILVNNASLIILIYRKKAVRKKRNYCSK